MMRRADDQWLIRASECMLRHTKCSHGRQKVRWRGGNFNIRRHKIESSHTGQVKMNISSCGVDIG